MEFYEKVEQIKEGENSKIYKCNKIDSKECFVIKKVKIDAASGVSSSALREIRSLKTLANASIATNIIDLEDIFTDQNFICLVFKHFPISLQSLISDGFSFSNDHVCSILYQLLSALDHVHCQGLIYRNLRPSHILFSGQGKLKIIDFSLARPHGSRMTNEIGLLSYRAPEILLGDCTYTNKIDSWAVGCILLEIKNKKPVFEAESDVEQCKLILSALGAPDIDYPWNTLFEVGRYAKKEPFELTVQTAFGHLFDTKILQLVKELLLLNKNTRLSATNALKLPVVKKGQNAVLSFEAEN